MPRLAIVLCSCLAALAAGATRGSAQQNPRIDGVRPELHVGLGWHGGLGLGGSADIPIVPDGLLAGVEDELALRPGGELVFDDDGGGRRDDDDIFVAALLVAQWNFYLTPEWSLFPELGLSLIFGEHGRRGDSVELHFVIALGGRYHITGRNAFVLRLSYPFGVQLGITF